MTCLFFYTPEHRCDAIRAHIHGHCSACGDWAIDYRNRWTHVGEPCAARRLGKWVALHGTVEARFVAGTPVRAAA
jgi:hypothetical protein